MDTEEAEYQRLLDLVNGDMPSAQVLREFQTRYPNNGRIRISVALFVRLDPVIESKHPQILGAWKAYIETLIG